MDHFYLFKSLIRFIQCQTKVLLKFYLKVFIVFTGQQFFQHVKILRDAITFIVL